MIWNIPDSFRLYSWFSYHFEENRWTFRGINKKTISLHKVRHLDSLWVAYWYPRPPEGLGPDSLGAVVFSCLIAINYEPSWRRCAGKWPCQAYAARRKVALPQRFAHLSKCVRQCSKESWRKTEILERSTNPKFNFEAQNLTFEDCFETNMTSK